MAWTWEDGYGGKITVYDIMYDPNTKYLYVDIEVIPGDPREPSALKCADIVAQNTATHGFLLESCIVGRKVTKNYIKRDWWIDYGVGINAQLRFGGIIPAIKIRRNEIRIGAPPPKASITSVTYNNKVVYPDSGVIEARPGADVGLSVKVKSEGLADGIIWCALVDPGTNEPISGGERKVVTVGAGRTSTISFTIKMPEEEKVIRVECGHIEGIV